MTPAINRPRQDRASSAGFLLFLPPIALPSQELMRATRLGARIHPLGTQDRKAEKMSDPAQWVSRKEDTKMNIQTNVKGGAILK